VEGGQPKEHSIGMRAARQGQSMRFTENFDLHFIYSRSMANYVWKHWAAKIWVHLLLFLLQQGTPSTSHQHVEDVLITLDWYLLVELILILFVCV